MTNNGPLVRELEGELQSYLGVRHCLLVGSGTQALQIAIKALQLKGEIITTPFSFVATSSAIAWEGCQPIFADIDPRSLCINPAKIEALITPSTSAILATHIYGIPCEVQQIQEIADKHRLKVIYDGAHAFGVSYKKRPLLIAGDVSTLSFHATKLFYTGEGGAVICNDDELAAKMKRMRDFGINGPEAFFDEVGINAKMSEFHAALGLCVLPTVGQAIARRQYICSQYDHHLANCGLTRPLIPPETNYNYAYYPVLFNNEASLKKAQKALNNNNIFPRRYFYPLLNRLPYVNSSELPVAEDVAGRVLCLPLYAELESNDVEYISDLIKQSIASK